jgi:hypothetical protein
MKPNFETMSKAELRAYVLEHREDMEALRSLMSRRDPNATKYNFPNTEEGLEQTKEIIKRQIKVYTLRELSEQAEKQRLDRLQNGLRDGEFRVYFQKSNLTIQIERNGKNCGVYIDLERCTNSDELLDWIFYIHGKEWGYSGGVIAAILTILDDACHDVFGKDAQTLFKNGKTINWDNREQ